MSTDITNVNLAASTCDPAPQTDNSGSLVSTIWAKTGFAFSLAANGYIKFPTWFSGLVIQWGRISMGGGGDNGVTFPIVFPHACLEVLATTLNTLAGGSGDRITYVVDGTQTTNGVTLSNNGSGASASWLAIGW